MPFPKGKNILPMWKYIFPPKRKGPKLLIKISAEIQTTCSAQVIIRGVWLNFLQNKGALEPIKEEIKEILCTGFRESYDRAWFGVFFLSAVSKLHFHNSFLATARVAGSQHNAVCSGCCLGWECPRPVPLDGCQSAAANISHRKKGYFFSQFLPLSDLNRISWDTEKHRSLPSRAFSLQKFQRSVANNLWIGFLQAKDLQEAFSMVTWLVRIRKSILTPSIAGGFVLEG